MKNLLLIVAAVVADSLPLSSKAQEISGNELHNACASEGQMAQLGFCLGYIAAQVEGQAFGAFMVLNRIEPREDVTELNDTIQFFLDYCTPDEVSNAQIRDVVIKFLREHPEQRHLSARWLTWMAMGEAFPCEPLD